MAKGTPYIRVSLSYKERAALMRLAQDSLRTDKDQARELLRTGLLNSGYLKFRKSESVVIESQEKGGET